MKPIAQPGQSNSNQMMKPRGGMQPFNPRTSEYTHTMPGGNTNTVSRGGMPNMEGINPMGKRVGMANFMDGMMPQLNMAKFTNPIAQLLARRNGGV